MDSIPVSCITSDESLHELEYLLRESGYIPRNYPNVEMVDVLRRWIHTQERDHFLQSHAFNYSMSNPAPQTTQLEKLQLLVLRSVQQEFIDAAVDTSTHASFMRDEIVMRVRGYVWAESESVRRQEVKYPADWWQSFKLRFMKSWPKLLQRKVGPVVYTTETRDVKAIYPTFRPSIPDYSSRLIVEKNR